MAAPTAVPPPQPHIGWGEVRHTRVWPRKHEFAYPTWFLMLPLRAWREDPVQGPARNRRAWASFHDADHGDGGPDALAWFDALMAQEGVVDADGEVWLHTFPRVLGFVFKPVSFWYAHRADGSLAAIVAEVNNTFGDRHCYLLRGPDLMWGHTLQASKVFHVSPFLPVSGDYRFRFLRSNSDRLVARVELHDQPGLVLRTSISGQLRPWSATLQRRALLSMPWLTLGIVARIHWQALQLWFKRLPFFRRPDPAHTPSSLQTR